MTDPIVFHALLFATGVLAGTINTVAGSGSLMTLPVLMWSGLDARNANATNRVGVLLQNVSAVVTYTRERVMPWRLLGRLALPSVLGALAGSLVAARVEPSVIKVVIAIAMVGATVATLLHRPKKKADPKRDGDAPKVAQERVSIADEPNGERPPGALAYAACVGVGFYAGIVQIGLGLVILAVLPRLLRVDLVRANALKVGLVLASQVVALGVFTAHGQVEPMRGASLAAGNVIGGWLGAKLAISRGEGFVRVLVLAGAIAGLAEVLWSLGR